MFMIRRRYTRIQVQTVPQVMCRVNFALFWEEVYYMIKAQQHETFMHALFLLGAEHKFPSLNDSSSISLSIVIPAYNEENRLPSMIDETIDFLEERAAQSSMFKYEMIIVDDGSKDKTTNVGLSYTKKLTSEKCRVLTLGKKRPKQ